MDQRFARQYQLIPADMRHTDVVVVGLGMLGSWTAHALVRCCEQVVGIDDDVVAPENVGTQAYDLFDVDQPKVAALAGAVWSLPFKAVPQRLTSALEPSALPPTRGDSLVVVACVDSMAARRDVAEFARRAQARLYVDTRAHGHVGVVVAVPSESYEKYEKYLSDLESDDEVPQPQCGAEGSIAAGLWTAQAVVSTLMRYFAGLPVPYKYVFDTRLQLCLTEVPME